MSLTEFFPCIKKKLEDMRFILANHTVRSMGVLMDVIAFTGSRPDALEAIIDAIISHLQQKALAGEDLSKDIAAFEKVDEQHWDGKYDSDPDGYDKDVRVSGCFIFTTAIHATDLFGWWMHSVV